jgi:CHASE3 domain sensor protein
MALFGEHTWFYKNILTNPFLNPIGAAIKLVQDRKEDTAQEEVNAGYQNQLDSANSELMNFVAAQNQMQMAAQQAQQADEQQDAAKNVLMVVIMLVIILFLLIKRKK